jgi:hypothetical protein
MLGLLRGDVMAMQMKTMKVVVMLVQSKDAMGRPKRVELVHEDDTVDVSKPENREFITCLVEPHLVAPKKPRAKG